MNPYETPGAVMDPPPDAGADGDVLRMRRFFGSYYRALGWISLGSTAIAIAAAYWIDALRIDLSFVLWFWLGSRLKAGSPTARKWAIGVFLAVSAFAAVVIFIGGGTASFGKLTFDRSQPVFYMIMGVVWVIFAIPGIGLLSRRGRRAYVRMDEGEEAAVADREARG